MFGRYTFAFATGNVAKERYDCGLLLLTDMLTISDLRSCYFELFRWIICFLARSFAWSFICPFVCSFTYDFILSFALSFIFHLFFWLVREKSISDWQFYYEPHDFITDFLILCANLFHDKQIFRVFCSLLFISFLHLIFYCNFSCKCERPSVPGAVICPSKKERPCGKDDW